MLPDRRLIAAAALLALSVLPAAGAQSAQKWSVQASGIYVGVYGTAYDGLKAGTGGEAQLRYTPSAWSFGVGGQFSQHDFTDPELSGTRVTLIGAFFEPRRVIDIGSSAAAPYVSARAAFLRQSVDVNVQGTTISASANGGQVNGGGGVLVRLSSRVNLDLGATYGLIKFSEVTVDVPGVGSTKISGSSGNGQNLVVRAGVAVGLR